MSTIRKIIPFSLYDIPGLEQWLEGQANQGLFPTHLGSWATFEDRGVPGTRFRLDCSVAELIPVGGPVPAVGLTVQADKATRLTVELRSSSRRIR